MPAGLLSGILEWLFNIGGNLVNNITDIYIHANTWTFYTVFMQILCRTLHNDVVRILFLLVHHHRYCRNDYNIPATAPRTLNINNNNKNIRYKYIIKKITFFPRYEYGEKNKFY